MEENIITVEQKKAQNYAVKGCAELKMAIKDVDTTGRVVTGFYNAYNYLDSDYDVLVMGAAKKSIKERGPQSKATAKIKHALNHDLTTLPGKIQVLEEKTLDNGISGIYFETKMTDTQLGNDTLKNYLEGIYDNHSIGFQYLQAEYLDSKAKNWQSIVDSLVNPQDAEKAGFLFLIKEISLFEGSTVAFGANKLTPFLGVKSGNKESLRLSLFNRIDKIEKTLRNGSQSDDMMESLEVQLLQFKQMISELTDMTTLPKITHNEPNVQKEDESKKGIDFKFLCNHFNL